MVSAHASGTIGLRFDPGSQREKFLYPNMLTLVSFAGLTLDKWAVLWIGTLTGCTLCRESHCRTLRNLVGFHPANRSVQISLSDNARVRQYIEKEKERTLKNQQTTKSMQNYPGGKGLTNFTLAEIHIALKSYMYMLQSL